MPTPEQFDVFASVEGPFDAGAVRLRSLRGHERISEVYEYVLDVWTVDLELSFQDLGHTDISVVLSDGSRTRRINGLCVGFEQQFSSEAAGNDQFVRSYRLRLRPWFALHGQSHDSRILEFGEDDPKAITDFFTTIAGEADANGTTVGSIARLFDSESSNITVHATGTPTRPLYVQYRESTLAFLSRLMERDGVTYHFEHLEDKGVHLHVCNDSAHHAPSDPAVQEFHGDNWYEGLEGIRELRTVGELSPGNHIGLSHDWQSTGQELVSGAAAADPNSGDEWRQSVAGLASYEYLPDPNPGGVADRIALVRDAAAARSTRIEGSGNSHLIRTGYTTTIHDTVADEEVGEFLVTETALTIESREAYAGDDDSVDDGVRCSVLCSFVGVPSSVPYRVPRRTPVPSPAGPQTALVVGVADNEITSDADLRVQVRFHWDQRIADADHLCWVRVAQPLAGAGFGTHFIPRQGMEVVVDFVDGQVDQPLVTGCVYNGRNAPAFPMPDSANIIGLRSRSTLDGTAETFSSLSIDDTQYAELMEVVAERDFRREVRNNDVLEVGLVHQDAGDQTITIQNDRTVTLNAGSDSLTVTEGDRTVDITAGNDTLTVGTDLTITTNDGKIAVTAGTTMSFEATDSITLTCGSASITLESSGDITISGANVVVEGSGNVDVTATGNATVGGMAAKLDGTTAEVAGSGSVDISGAIVNIN